MLVIKFRKRRIRFQLKHLRLRKARREQKKIWDQKNMMKTQKNQFWKTKTLREMTKAEWESLCDNCGVCCLHKIQDEDTGKVKVIAVSCRFLNTSTCRCSVYEDRRQKKPECRILSPEKISPMKRLPYTCAYRCLAEGRELEWWHPLVSGDPNTVHQAGISVKNKVVCGIHVHPDDLGMEYCSSAHNDIRF